MAEIIKSYKQSIGAMKFIGKKYGDADRANGTFGAKWGEWFENGWFGVIEKQISGSIKDITIYGVGHYERTGNDSRRCCSHHQTVGAKWH